MDDRSYGTVGLEELRRRIARLEGGRRCDRKTSVSSGSAAIDNLLPEKGFRRGTLVEWLSEGEGTGACTLALLAAASIASVVAVRRKKKYSVFDTCRLKTEN